jgi:uncharacterized membrane protein
MTLAPLLNASPAIQVHAFSAMAAFALGVVQFAAPKGTLAHRTMGWAWVALMVVVSVSAFFIHQIKLWGTWSPIHLLAGFTLVGLGVAVHAARHHVIARHQRAMMALFFGALVIAGGSTFMPGRIMNAVITSPGPDLEMLRILIGAPSWVWLLLGLLIWLGLRNLRQRTMPAWTLAILPAIALVLAPARILSAPNLAVSTAVYILVAVAFLWPGQRVGQSIAAGFVPAQGRVTLPGSPFWLLFGLSIFVVNFAFGVASAVRPDFAHDSLIALAPITIGGALLGFAAGRQWNLYLRYRRAGESLVAA